MDKLYVQQHVADLNSQLANMVSYYMNAMITWQPPPSIPWYIPTAAVFVIALVGAYWVGVRSRSWWRTREMRRERELKEKAEIGDAITNYIEDRIHNGKWTRDRADFWYRRLGHVLTIQDLLPKRMKALKDSLKEKHKDRPKSNVVPIKKLGRDKFLAR